MEFESNEESEYGEEKKEINEDYDTGEKSDNNEWDEIDWSEVNSDKQEESIWNEINWNDEGIGEQEETVSNEIDWEEPESEERAETDSKNEDGEIESEQNYEGNEYEQYSGAIFGEDGEFEEDLPEVPSETGEFEDGIPEIFGEIDDDDSNPPEIFGESAENNDNLNNIIQEREEGERTDEDQASGDEGDVYENIGSESTTTVLMSETENPVGSMEQDEEIDEDNHEESEEADDLEEKNEEPDEITSTEEFEYFWNVREKLDREGKSEEEIKEVMHEAEEMYKTLKEAEKLYEEEQQEKLKQVDHEGEATKEDLKEDLDRVDLVEQSVEIEENLAQQGKSQEEIDNEVEKAMEISELNEEIEKLYEEQQQEKIRKANLEEDESLENTKEVLDRTDLVEQAVEIEEDLAQQGKSQEEIDKEVEKAMEMSELNEEIEKLYEEQQREKIRQVNLDDEESGVNPKEEIDRPSEAEYYMEKEEELHRQGILQEEIDEQMEEIANEYQKEITETQEKEKEPNAREELKNSELEIMEQNLNTEQRNRNELSSSLTNEKETETSENTEGITPEFEAFESESEEKKENLEDDTREVREKTEEEEEDEELQELYRQKTGKRPIYSGKKTKGYTKWLEQQEVESEKPQKAQHEREAKEEIEEEDWRTTLKRWIREASEDECNSELKSELRKALERYKEFEDLIKKFIELYDKIQHENLSEEEERNLKSLIEKLQKFDPVQFELLANIRAIKIYINEQYWWDSMNRFRAYRVRYKFFEQISQKYKNLKKEILKLKEDNENKSDVNLSNDYEHFISLLSSPNTRQKAIKAWQIWSLEYNPSTISKEIKDRVRTTISFIKALKSEIQKIIPQSSLRKENGILKLSDRKLSLLLGSINFFINKTIRKAHEKHFFKIALDVLLTWKINLNSNSEIIGSPENAIALIDTYINLHKPVIPISRNQNMQLYRFHRFIDEDYFELIDTIEKAYWLGFFFADGTITELHGKRNFISFTLKSTDSLQIIRFCGSLGLNPNYIKNRTTRRLYKGEWRYYKAVGIGFTSSKIAKTLFNLGFKGSKSKKTEWPLREFGNPLLDLAFLLGFYDGEGKEGRTDMKVGNKKIIEQIKEKFGIPYEIDESDGQFRLSLGSQLMNLMQSIFQKSLPRKRKIFKVWTHINPESNLLTFMTPSLLQALINIMSPEKLSKILKLDDPIFIYNLIKKWNLKIF